MKLVSGLVEGGMSKDSVKELTKSISKMYDPDELTVVKGTESVSPIEFEVASSGYEVGTCSAKL